MDVQIGSADTASLHLDQDIVVAELGKRDLDDSVLFWLRVAANENEQQLVNGFDWITGIDRKWGPGDVYAGTAEALLLSDKRQFVEQRGGDQEWRGNRATHRRAFMVLGRLILTDFWVD